MTVLLQVTKVSLLTKNLRSKVSKFAGALKNQGVIKGDRVIIYMPMIPEAVIAMLACARIGAIHSVVFGGFASNELASRIDDSKAKLLVTLLVVLNLEELLNTNLLWMKPLNLLIIKLENDYYFKDQVMK